MSDQTPHFAFPLRFRAGRFLAVEQDSQRHFEDQADVLVRTRPGTFDHDPDFGLRNLLGDIDALAPTVLKALERSVPAEFEVSEAGVAERVRDVAIRLDDAGEG